jgi:type IV pilus assembly protein PilA
MGARQSVTDNAINGQNFISGWTTPSPTDNVQSVGINPVNGEVTITFSNKVFPPSGKTLVLSPRDGGNTGRNLQPGSPPTTGQITWNCNAIDQNSSTHPGNKGTIQSKYLLANCPETGMLVSEVFVKRSLVTEGLGLAAGAKASVADNAINGQPFASGWTPPSATDIVSSVIINPENGEITITYTDKVASADANTLILSPIDGGNTGINLSLGSPPASGAITWYCNSAEQSGSWTHLGNKGSISGNYVPANCR